VLVEGDDGDGVVEGLEPVALESLEPVDGLDEPDEFVPLDESDLRESVR
jgi:hypothetical protein